MKTPNLPTKASGSAGSGGAAEGSGEVISAGRVVLAWTLIAFVVFGLKEKFAKPRLFFVFFCKNTFLVARCCKLYIH